MKQTQKTDVIVTESVTKVYAADGIPVNALNGIDLTIESGEFTALVGPSGSGKTTFLNIISGLDSPTEGKVWLAGKVLSEMSGNELSDFRRDNIGFIFQAYNLIPVLTVEENVEYIMLLAGVPKAERHERVIAMLETVGLKGVANRTPTQLSGGQQQRVAIARAMVSEPTIILADEPTANLDSKTGADLLEMMRHLNAETGMTFIFSTHDPMVMESCRASDYASRRTCRYRRDEVEMRKILAFITCLMTAPLVGTANSEFQVGGYYKNFSTAFNSPLPDASMMGIVVNRLRLNFSYAPTDSLSFDFAYDFTPRVQDPLLFSQPPIAVGIASSRYRLADFEASIYPGTDAPTGSVGIYHNLDRAAVQFSTDFADFSIGRDAIAWGSARIINPTDIIAPYTFDQLDTEDRVGVDAFRVRIPVGVMGEIDTGYIFGSNFDFDKSAVFLRTQLNAVETDFSILLLEFPERSTRRFRCSARHWRRGILVRRRLTCLPPGLMKVPMFRITICGPPSVWIIASGERPIRLLNIISMEQAQGKPENFLKNLEQPAYTRGGVYLLGTHYLAPGIAYQLTPLISLSGQMLFNLSDPSTWIAPQIAYNVAEDIHLSVGGFISIGKRPKNGDSTQFQSEFGSYPNLFFSSFRVYF